MNVKEALLARRSVRKFTQESVSDAMIDELLHAAMSGPSARNMRPWAFYVVTQEEALEKLRGASRFTNIHAPLAIVVCGDLARALPKALAQYWVQDCSAATENILLSAVGMGLGAVWCGVYPKAPAQEKVTKLLELDEKKIPLGILFIGHPAETPAPRDQYEADRVHFIR